MLFLGSVGTLVWLMEFFSWKSEIDQKMSGVHLGVIVNTEHTTYSYIQYPSFPANV